MMIGLVALPVLIFFFVRSLVDFPRKQRMVSLIVRSAVVILLVLSLAGLTLLKPTQELFVVYAVDESLSVGAESEKVVEDFISKSLEKSENNETRFVRFAAEPGEFETEWKPAEKSPKPTEDISPPLGASTTEDDSTDDEAKEEDGTPTPINLPSDNVDESLKATNIAAAIEVIAAGIPPHYVPRIVMITDGNETKDDALKAALSSGIQISTLPLKTRDDPEVQVSAVTVPAQVAQGEPFFVEVVIDSNHADEGKIEVYRGPHKVISEDQKLKKGENKYRFRQSIDRDRLAEFTVRISGFQDTLLDNNSDSGLVFASGKPRVLLIESSPELARHMEWALEEEGILVDTRPPQGMPDSLADLQNYEILVLSNVPATDLSTRKMEVARTYVSDLGGGLVMIGGDQSFGLGGYYKTVLEEVLPVRSDFEKEKEKPSLAMVIVMDKSGSMGGQKIELAKDAAKSAVELLGPRDQIGVIAFEGSSYWVSELRPLVDKSLLMDRISTIVAGGGTNLYPAMDDAFQALQSASAKLKHVIILTDGHSSPGDFTGITQAMSSARITVSTVGVGQGADQNLLEEIAQIGRGRYYFTDDPLSIPQIFAKETMTASKSAINEEPFLPQVIRPSQVFADIDFDQAPLLLGYVVTRPKPTSEVLLGTETGDPLLAWWRYGLGMSVAFTSDAKSRWASEWLSWPGFNRFWAQIVRNSMRKSEAKGFLVDVQRKGSESTVSLDSVDLTGRYLNNAKTELNIIDPQLGNQKIPMRQTAPGKYVTEFETLKPGAYHLEMAQEQDGKVLYRQTRGLMVGYPDELRLRPTNEKLLKSIADASGGTYDPKPEDIYKNETDYADRATPLWPYLLTAALVLFLLDVALRRIDFSLLLPARVGARR